MLVNERSRLYVDVTPCRGTTECLFSLLRMSIYLSARYSSGLAAMARLLVDPSPLGVVIEGSLIVSRRHVSCVFTSSRACIPLGIYRHIPTHSTVDWWLYITKIRTRFSDHSESHSVKRARDGATYMQRLYNYANFFMGRSLQDQ